MDDGGAVGTCGYPGKTVLRRLPGSDAFNLLQTLGQVEWKWMVKSVQLTIPVP